MYLRSHIMFHSYNNSAYFIFLVEVVKVPFLCLNLKKKKTLLDLASDSSSCCSNFDPRKTESGL